MRGMPFNLPGEGASFPLLSPFPFPTQTTTQPNNKNVVEPRSVLEQRSPSPPTSSSTLSSSLGGSGGGGTTTDTAGVAAVSDPTLHQKWDPTDDRKDEWASDLQPIHGPALSSDKFVVDDWESMLSDAPSAPDQSFLHWVMGDASDSAKSVGLPIGEDPAFAGLVDPILGFDSVHGSTGFMQIPAGPSSKPGLFGNPTGFSGGFSAGPQVFFQEPMEEKPQVFPSNVLLNLQQTQPTQSLSCYMPFGYAQSEQNQNHHQQYLMPPQPKRHHSMPEPGPKVPFSYPGPDLFLRRHQHQPQPQQVHQQGFGSLPGGLGSFHNLQQRPAKPKLAGDELSAGAASSHHQQLQLQQQQALVDQLVKAAELVETRNSVNAREILARLNHQLSPQGKPLVRSAFYFKEALNNILAGGGHLKPAPGPMDVVLKLSAYKFFSEVSPVPQFVNFTCIQVLLEELGGCGRIHVVDFDIGIGGHWSSFMQELSQRRGSAAAAGTPSLKITAFVSPSSHHPLELALTRENLSHFASDLGIPFEFNVLTVDSFDPAIIANMASECGEAIAVNLPVSPMITSNPTLLRLVKQLSPKIVVSVDHDSDHDNLSFSQYFVNAMHSTNVLLESIDAAGTNTDVTSKIEKFLLQPRIENAISFRYRVKEETLTWRAMFASAGFVPVPFSNFTETQAECLLKRTQARGFHAEKRQSSLLLFWQRGELVSVSAWKC